MTVLWIPHWNTPAEFCINRGYTDLLVVGWHHANILSAGPTIVLEETVFGGYQIHIKLKPYVYAWNSSTFLFEDVFEDFYATSPGSPTPINALDVYLQWRTCDPTYRRGFVFDMPAGDPYYYFFELPPAPNDYWAKDRTPIPPMPFIYHPS